MKCSFYDLFENIKEKIDLSIIPEKLAVKFQLKCNQYNFSEGMKLVFKNNEDSSLLKFNQFFIVFNDTDNELTFEKIIEFVGGKSEIISKYNFYTIGDIFLIETIIDIENFKMQYMTVLELFPIIKGRNKVNNKEKIIINLDDKEIVEQLNKQAKIFHVTALNLM